MKREELDVTARLACLQLSEAEVERFESAVAQMLEYFSKMREFDTEGLSPTDQKTSANRIREDVVSICRDTDSLLANAPELEDRFIVIPNVL